MNKMKVALLRVIPQEKWRSIEVYADRLARGLQAIDHNLEIIEVKVPGWNFPDIRFPTPYGRPASLRTLGIYLTRWIKYPLALKKLSTDVYHILDNSYGHLTFFLNPHRTVVTSHGGTPQTWRKWYPNGPAMWIFELAFRGMLQANRIIAVSQFAQQEIISESDYPHEHIHTISHGVDPIFRPFTDAERQAIRESLLIDNEQYLLLHVGHSASRKNVEALYLALANLLRDGYSARLIRIGGLPTESQSRLIRSRNLDDHITHISYLPNSELPAYYNAANVFVFPSLYEGFGVPVIEAMACGTPVICSNSASLPEVVGEAGLLIDPQSPQALSEAIEQVLTDLPLAKELRQRGLGRARRFTWQRTAEQTLQVYQRLIDQ